MIEEELPVPREQLDPDILIQIGEALDGEPLVINADIAFWILSLPVAMLDLDDPRYRVTDPYSDAPGTTSENAVVTWIAVTAQARTPRVVERSSSPAKNLRRSTHQAPSMSQPSTGSSRQSTGSRFSGSTGQVRVYRASTSPSSATTTSRDDV